MTDPNDKMLDDLFGQARHAAPPVSDDLMARVLADADGVRQTGKVVVADRGLWPRLLVLVGGWPAVSGLAAATIAGVWVGVSPPVLVDVYTAELLGDTVTVSLFSDADPFAVEGLDDG